MRALSLAMAPLAVAVAQSASAAGTSTTTVDVVRVTGKRLSEEQKAIERAAALDVVDLSGEAMRSVDMGTILRRTRGVVLRQTGGLGSATTLSLNGLSGRQVPIFLDGLPIELSGFSTNLSAVPVGLVSKLEIHKGVVPVELASDALGGAIDLRTREGRRPRAFVSYENASFATHRALFDVHTGTDSIYGSIQGWYDRSANDYRITVDAVDADTGRLVRDGLVVAKNNADFESFGVSAEAGLERLLFADRLAVRGFVGASTQGLPHDVTQETAYGEVQTGLDAAGGWLRYEKYGILERLDIDLAVGLVRRANRLSDLAESRYDFEGNRTAPIRGELVSGGIDQTLDEWLVSGRLNLSYRLTDEHGLVLTAAPQWERRSGARRAPDEDASEARPIPQDDIRSLVGGLAHRWRPFDLPMENDLFFKVYAYEARGEEVLLGFSAGRFSSDTLDVGVGDAWVFRAGDAVIVRASGEWATRLPDFTEIMGDAVLESGNPELRPERSLNLNLSVSALEVPTAVGTFGGTLWGFSRLAEDLIQVETGGGRSRYVNVDSAIIYGLETDAQWSSPGDWVRVSGTFTWEETRNTSLEGAYERFRDDRLPNRPYLYGSAAVSVGGRSLLFGGDEARLSGHGLWVHEFFRLWPSAGALETKAVIPEQIRVDVDLLYTFLAPFDRRTRVGVSFECRNLLDDRLFDRLRAELPGRSLHFKVSGSFED